MKEQKEVSSSNMEQVRTLVLGPNNEQITSTVKANARAMVKDVISEAMHDRQQQDGSLSKTIVPMIESAVEQSIENNKSNFITYLYPIVGSLVRKSVTVFFNGFLEKLNSLIEYSLTFKGLKWRMDAWRKGIPFTRYIIKQSFIYRVEQVFFIHRDSGLLLNHVVLENNQFNDASLVSAMLIAISDFMADSFNSNTEDNLDTIKTENYTLVIQAGPEALLVAAVTGAVPNDLKSHLQLTLENLHALYHEDLQHFEGDDSPFVSSESHLRDCLLSEINPSVIPKKKKPVFAIAIVVGILILFCAWCYQLWQESTFIDDIWNAPRPAGIYLQKVTRDAQGFNVEYLRDPSALSAPQWLKNSNISIDQINFREHAYVSLDSEIIQRKVQDLLRQYPDIIITVKQNQLYLSGSINQHLLLSELADLKSISGVSTIDQEQLVIKALDTSREESTIAKFALLKQHISDLATQPIDFDVQSNSLNTVAKKNLAHIATKISRINNLSKSLKTPVGIIISGYSDFTGSSEKNKLLSAQRAESVKEYLLSIGVDSSILFAVGVGEVKIDAIANASRKVVFSTIYLANSIEKEVQ
jgi:outer membrane protein OmpA-like peptidoglycan-associated protein